MSACQARQQSDEMVCTRCVLRWDVHDPDPPPCLPHPAPPLVCTHPVTRPTDSGEKCLDCGVILT